MTFPNNISIWHILKLAEVEKKIPLTTAFEEHKDKKLGKVQYYSQPVVNFMSTDLATNSDLRKTTLATLGVKSGSAVLRVRFKPTEIEYKEFLAADAALIESEAEEYKATEQRISDAKTAAKQRYEEEMSRKAEEEKARKIAEENEASAAREAAARAAEQREAEKFLRERELATQQSLESASSGSSPISSATSSSAPQSTHTSQKNASSSPSTNAMQVDPASSPVAEQPRKKFEVVVEPPGPPGMYRETLDELMDNDSENRRRLHELLRKADGSVIEKANQLPSEPCPRDVRVFAPSTKPFDPSSIELPDDFFSITKEDIAKDVAKVSQNAHAPSSDFPKTKHLKEKERLIKLSRFKKCFIRFRFPDRVEVQAAFYPQETSADLVSFITSQLIDPSLDFYLFTTPPTTNLHPTKNLRDQGFLPAALVHVGLSPGAKAVSPFIKPEILALIEEKSFKPAVREFKSATEVKIVASDSALVSAATAQSSSSMDVDESQDKDDTKLYASSSKDAPKDKKSVPKWFTSGMRKK